MKKNSRLPPGVFDPENVKKSPPKIVIFKLLDLAEKFILSNLMVPNSFFFYLLLSLLLQSNLSLADTYRTLCFCPLLGGVRYKEERLIKKVLLNGQMW